LATPLGAGTKNNVPDIGGVQVIAFRKRLQNHCPQVLWMLLGKGALAPFANASGGAAGVNDPGFGHIRCSLLGVANVRGVFWCALRLFLAVGK
jgi:hypothetical protein